MFAGGFRVVALSSTHGMVVVDGENSQAWSPDWLKICLCMAAVDGSRISDIKPGQGRILLAAAMQLGESNTRASAQTHLGSPIAVINTDL